MNLKDIERILKKLSKDRPIFHSEADFQHALAITFAKEYPTYDIRLEKRIESGEEKLRNYVDLIIISDNEEIFIELKYKTKRIKEVLNFKGEEFLLLNQGAQDLGMYSFVKDISDLEKIKSNKSKIKKAFTIFLTNDSYYWKRRKKQAIFDQFYIFEENSLNAGELRLHPTEKTKKLKLRWENMGGKNKEGLLILKHNYGPFKWKEYSTILGLFKYLVVEVIS